MKSLLEKAILYYDDLCYDEVWYVGVENNVQEGIYALYDHLDGLGLILVEADIFDSFNYALGSSNDPEIEISYRIVYKALSKLEYLEYRASQKRLK